MAEHDLVANGESMADAKIDSKRLSEADIESFVEHGFVLLRGLLSAEDVETAVADWPEILKDIRQRGNIAAELLTAPGAPLAEVTTSVVTVPRPHTPEAVWDRVGSQRAAPPHLDNQAITLSGGALGGDLGAFVFLNQVKHAAGAFMYSPGSSGRMRAWMSANAFESAPGRARSLPVGGIMEECTAEPGDVIVFDAHIVHCASANVVGPERQALRLYDHPDGAPRSRQGLRGHVGAREGPVGSIHAPALRGALSPHQPGNLGRRAGRGLRAGDHV